MYPFEKIAIALFFSALLSTPPGNFCYPVNTEAVYVGEFM